MKKQVIHQTPTSRTTLHGREMGTYAKIKHDYPQYSIKKGDIAEIILQEAGLTHLFFADPVTNESKAVIACFPSDFEFVEGEFMVTEVQL